MQWNFKKICFNNFETYMQGFIYCLPGYLFDHHSKKMTCIFLILPCNLLQHLLRWFGNHPCRLKHLCIWKHMWLEQRCQTWVMKTFCYKLYQINMQCYICIKDWFNNKSKCLFSFISFKNIQGIVLHYWNTLNDKYFCIK